jgi:beta-mannosidase
MARSAAAAAQPKLSYSEIDLSGDFALSSPAQRVKAKTIALPGDVHTALLAAGDIPDPYFGANEQAVMWVHATPWTVERRFTATREPIDG